MQNEKNIALFIDVDNCALNTETYNNAIEEIKERGKIVYGKVYGLSDRRHNAIIAIANNYGFDTTTVMRNKRRGRRDFDQRMFIDVMEIVLNYNHIDAVAIVAPSTEMDYFYSKLHQFGVNVIALDNVDDAARELIDDVIDIGMVEYLRPISNQNLFVSKEESQMMEKEEKVDSEEDANFDVEDEVEYSPEDERLLTEIRQLLADYNK